MGKVRGTRATLLVSGVAVTGADGITQGGNKVADVYHIQTPLLASSVDSWVFIASRPVQVVSVSEAHSVVGGSSAAVRPRKITDTSAPGAAAGSTVKELTQAAFDLTATINTVVNGTLSATPSDLQLATGDKIALDFSGTLTGLVGALVIGLRPI